MEDDELIEENAATDSDDEESELGHDVAEVGDAEDLGGDDAADADGGDPHDGADHPHDHLVDHGEELDDTRRLLTQGSEHSSKSQAEEYDPKSVGSIPNQAKMDG